MDYFNPDCPHAGKCDSQGYKCSGCRHNKKAKEDHYDPIKPWPGPYRWVTEEPCMYPPLNKYYCRR